MDAKKAKGRLTLFYIALGCCIASVLLCAGCLIGTHFISQSAYRDLTTISSATDSRTRVTSYKRAIRLCPTKADAYLLLLNAFGEDGTFTKTESEEFISVYNQNHSKLPVDANYRKIHSEAGLLYINAYEDTPTVRLRMALPFFEAAQAAPADTPDIVTDCYAGIGQYYRDYIWATGIKEVPPSEISALLDSINSTLDALIDTDTPDAIYNRLGFSCAVCNLLYDQRDVLAATVPKETVFEILDILYLSLPTEQQLQAQQSKEMVHQLRENEQMYYDMLTRAYERGEV